MEGEDEEDYGDYVTRCVCGFKHDDGYMICCDECSVWQHLECMKIDPNHIPDKYLCEQCEPRAVDKKRARQLQVKKKESLAEAQRGGAKLRSASRVEAENNDNGSSEDSRKQASPHPSGPQSHRKKKRAKHLESRVRSDSRKRKRDDRRPAKKKATPARSQLPSEAPASFVTTTTVATSGLQSLLNAASLLEESTSQYLWDTDTSPWTDKYDTAELNRYSEPVRSFLSSRLLQLKTEALVYNKDDYSTIESRKPQPQCCEQQKRKGIMAESVIEKDELIMEYKGKITVKHAVLSDSSIGGKSLWKHKPCPFVYLYDKITDLDLCIDARHYGNIARFIRRSCAPNAEVRHFFVASELRFGIYALKKIDPGEEITVPFDFRYEKCDYPVECACAQKTLCLVARANHTILNRKIGSKGVEEDQSGPPKQNSVIPPTEDSNSSFTSTGSRKRVTRSQQLLLANSSPDHKQQVDHQSGEESSDCGEEEEGGCEDMSGAVGIGGQESNGHLERQDSQDAHEDQESSIKGKASQSREERKNEAVWKVFEKMEASSSRRKHQLMSDDSNPLPSSPSNLPTTPIMFGPKHRRLSASQRSSILPNSRVRLSSVSSDPFSPADISETFSPPITPKHTAQDLFCIPHSPIADAPHYRLEFEATPYLHPKYLLSNFELPWKKAVLKQLEMAQYSNGFRQHPFVHSVHNKANGKIRTRGSQKHRWLKLHADNITKALLEKENHKAFQEATEQSSLPTKKHVLMKWEKSLVGDGARPNPMPQGSNMDSSPLFDEVSSEGEDFEVAGDRGGSRKHVASSGTGGQRKSHNHSALSPSKDSQSLPTQGSPEHMRVGDECTGPRTPPVASTNSKQTNGMSDDIDCSAAAKTDVETYRGVNGGGVGPKTPPPAAEGATTTHHVDEGTRAVLPPVTGPSVGKDVVDEVEACAGAGGCDGASGDANKSDLFEGGGDSSFRLDEGSPMSPHNKAGSQGGRKKISLGDYLKRPRKPPEQRKPPSLPPLPISEPSIASSTSSMSSVQTIHPVIPPTSVSTPVGNSYSAVSPTTAGTPVSSTTTPSASGAGGLQFEPVSPGDEDGTPPLVTMEDSGALVLIADQTQQMATRMVPVMTIYGNQSLATVAEQQQQQQPPVVPVTFIQQQFPGQFVPVIEARWNQNGMELSQDPRRGAIPSELFAQQTILAPSPNQDGVPPLPSQLHGGLLPHPVVVQQAGPHPLMQQAIVSPHGEVHQGLIPRPDFMSRQHRGFVPHHQHRQLYKHHSQSGFYQ